MHFLHKYQSVRGPFLIVCPLSVCVNWQREINLWTDLDAVIYHGSVEDREMIRKYEFGYVHKKGQGSGGRSGAACKLEVLITTPETCAAWDRPSSGRTSRALSAIHWDLLVVDEAHKLKNYDSKFSTVLRDEYSFQNCLLLTGTPLQNDTNELFSLLSFVAPDQFDDKDKFINDFGDLKTTSQLQKLHSRLRPYLLRREKEVVERSVPVKEEVSRMVLIDSCTEKYTKQCYEHLLLINNWFVGNH